MKAMRTDSLKEARSTFTLGQKMIVGLINGALFAGRFVSLGFPELAYSLFPLAEAIRKEALAMHKFS